MAKTLPFDRAFLEQVAQKFPTPFYLYDEKAIRANARRLNAAFAWSPGYREYFAVKALPNPRICKILMEEGCGFDCSSLAELIISEKLGAPGERIMFTSNNTSAKEYVKARELGAIINLDDISHIDFLEKCAGLPDTICMRFNPGPERTGNAIIGKPSEAKFGFTREQLFEGYRRLKAKGVKRFGLHTMVASNELNADYFNETARMLFTLIAEVAASEGVQIEFVNLGGGIGIPYKPEQSPVNLEALSAEIQKLYQEMIVAKGLPEVRILMENGRVMTGPYGYLVTRVIHGKDIYKKYVGVDACMANLMRPGMYGSYHHITIAGKENAPAAITADVVGSLCENNDKFAVDRPLPAVEIGDLAVIHDAGAHGHAMGFQYNGKLRCAELLLRENGAVEMIRRAETLDDYFATLVW